VSFFNPLERNKPEPSPERKRFEKRYVASMHGFLDSWGKSYSKRLATWLRDQPDPDKQFKPTVFGTPVPLSAYCADDGVYAFVQRRKPVTIPLTYTSVVTSMRCKQLEELNKLWEDPMSQKSQSVMSVVKDNACPSGWGSQAKREISLSCEEYDRLIRALEREARLRVFAYELIGVKQKGVDWVAADAIVRKAETALGLTFTSDKAVAALTELMDSQLPDAYVRGRVQKIIARVRK